MMLNKEKEILLNIINKLTISKKKEDKREILKYIKDYIDNTLNNMTFSKESDSKVVELIKAIIEAEKDREGKWGKTFLFQEVNIYFLDGKVDFLININNYDRERVDDIPFKEIINDKIILKDIKLGKNMRLKSNEGSERNYSKIKRKTVPPVKITLSNLRSRLIIKSNGQTYILQLFFADMIGIELVEHIKYSTFLRDNFREKFMDNANKYPEVIKLELRK